MDPHHHWENIYQSKAPDQVSWYQEHSQVSLSMIRGTGIAKTAHIIDVGGGASTLVDDLLAEGFDHLSVLDISETALEAARRRLGERADSVHWILADITRADLPQHAYDLWHDRATFHFLTDPGDRQRYVRAVRHAVRPGGHVIIATFAVDGPEECSGLSIVQYDPQRLLAEFGGGFTLIGSTNEAHQTPRGDTQRFVYCHCRITQAGGM